MRKKELEEWIENMEYDLEQLNNTKIRIEHLEKVRKKDILFLKKKLKILKEKGKWK